MSGDASRRRAPAGDRVRVTVAVAVAPADAFAVFTAEIDRWWCAGMKFRPGGRRVGVIQLEAGVGGRLLESFADHVSPARVELGRVTVWEPPARLVFEWRGVNLTPDEKTEVEVTFEPSASGTLVTVEHRGWSALRADHPARHGLTGAAFGGMMGRWWGDLLTSLREYARTRTHPGVQPPGER